MESPAMMNDSKLVGNGVISIVMPDVGSGEVAWMALAIQVLSGAYVGWHLDGHVTVGESTRRFENLMMDDRMCVDTINLLMENNQEAQSYIVSAVAEYTGLGIELTS